MTDDSGKSSALPILTVKESDLDPGKRFEVDKDIVNNIRNRYGKEPLGFALILDDVYRGIDKLYDTVRSRNSSCVITFEESSGFQRGGTPAEFFDIVEGKLNTNVLSMSDSWTEMEFENFDSKNNDIGRLFPFKGRDKEVAVLGKLLLDLMSWWKAVGPKMKAGAATSELHKKDVVAGFAFFVIGAASGIGKSTFARRAFRVLMHMLSESKTANDLQKELASYLNSCLLSRVLFRVTYVNGLEDFERKEPKLSIALRILFEYCKRQLKEPCMFSAFCNSFVQFPAVLTLSDVLDWIEKRTGSKMFVIHIDETNHLAAKDSVYIVRTMQSMYTAMLSRQYFVTCLFSGTNAQFLMNLKQTSNFEVKPIHLSPLPTSVLCEILQEVTEKVSGQNEKISPQLVWLLAENGGNPQILKSQVFLMGSFGVSMPNEVPNLQDALMAADRPTALHLREYKDWDTKNFLEFMHSQEIRLIAALRDNTQQHLLSSHILSSVEKLRECKPLQRMLLGYAISGDLVRRETELLEANRGWTVGAAENAGYIYMSSISLSMIPDTELFRVVFPRIFMSFFAFGAASDELFNLDILKSGWAPLSFRNIEYLDVTSLAFFFEWRFNKQPQDLTCNLQNVFPLLNLPSITLKRPTNFRHATIRFSAAKGEDFVQVASNFAQEATFTLGSGNDSFPDAWGHFTDSSNNPFTIFVQSRKTITNVEFTTAALHVQLGYLTGIQNWILFVITDGTSSAVIPAGYGDRVFIIEKGEQHKFYGNMLATMRQTALQVEAEGGLQRGQCYPSSRDVEMNDSDEHVDVVA